MRRHRGCHVALWLAPILGVSALACVDERGIQVDLGVNTEGDRLCVLAFGAGERVFAQSYGGTDGPPPTHGTLSFVAGDRVSDVLRVTARVSSGGAITGSATGEAAFSGPVATVLPLAVRRCQTRPRRLDAPTLRTLARLDAPGAAPRIAAMDVDGDGRDELLGPASAGMLPRIDVSGVEGVVTLVPTALASGESLRFVGDLDGDCTLDAVSLTARGTRVALAAGSGAPEGPALAPAAVDAAAGGFGPAGRSALATAGPTGVVIVPWRGDAPTTTLTPDAATSVAVGDISGDVLSDLVASTASGARMWIGSATGPMPAMGGLPMTFDPVTGPIAVGDVDGDDLLDVVGAAGTAITIALNRGVGALEDATPMGVPATRGNIIALIVADLDGDCRDDITTLDQTGEVRVLKSRAPLVLEPASTAFPASSDLVAADLDGDGARELVLLSRMGELIVWGP